MEFQARITDNKGILDLPIEEKSSAKALVKAYKAKLFIQEKYLPDPDQESPLHISSLSEVIRHDKDFIEHRIIWSAIGGFRKSIK